MPNLPPVSVVVPTYKRPVLLERAVRSVLGQTHRDFELIICDDEVCGGSASGAGNGSGGREVAHRLATEDSRIRVVANPGPHGQVGNVNQGLSQARHEWVSVLYDDDVMEPMCLERMLQAVLAAGGMGGARETATGVGMVRCLSRFYVNGVFASVEPLGKRARVELLREADAAMAFMCQDVDIGIPSQVMVPRRLITAGVLLEEHPKLRSNVDTLWFMKLLRHGPLLLVNEGLIQQHQGEHETVTSVMTEDDLYAEFALLRAMQHANLNDAQRERITLRTAVDELRVIRAFRNLTRGRLWCAAKLAARTPNPRAWALAIRWILRRKYPGRFELLPREVILR